MKNLILSSIVALSLLTLVGCANDSSTLSPNGVSGTGNSVQGDGGGTSSGTQTSTGTSSQ
jgi:hypothetical protein